jgi:hypothetical protein
MPPFFFLSSNRYFHLPMVLVGNLMFDERAKPEKVRTDDGTLFPLLLGTRKIARALLREKENPKFVWPT